MSNLAITGTHSYIINNKSKQKIFNKLKENNFQQTIDVALNELLTKNYLKVFCIYPFVSTHQYLHSNIERLHTKLPIYFEAISQKAFFKDTNHLDLKEIIIRYSQKIGFEISPMNSFSAILKQILLIKDFVKAKYKYKDRLI